MEQAGTQARPVPAPRRLYPELRAANYENIEINVPSSSSSSSRNNNIENSQHNHTNNNNNNNSGIKKLNISAENLHGNCGEKKLPAGGHSKLILQEQNVVDQPIYGPDANENVPAMEPVYALPRPAPRQRARAELLEEEEREQEQELGNDECDEVAEPELTKASPRVLRAAPQVPSKQFNVEQERRRPDRCSISSEFSTTSLGAGNGQLDGGDDSRYTSNASLDCSESGSQSGKFKSPSPGNLLRSLGNTSKLLGEAIGERVAFKAKGAKKRLDKNLKSSTEALSSLSADASSRLKDAGKRIGSNFSLGRKEKVTSRAAGATPLELEKQMELERRRTMPNTDVFNAIQFSSPLHRNVGHTDLSTAQEQAELAYEVPKAKPKPKPKAKPPSYDEALRSRPAPPPPQPQAKMQPQTQPQSQPLAKSLAQEAMQQVQLRNPQAQQQRQSSSGDSTGEELPMPTFPAPRLSQHLDALQPPARHKRRKNYENIQLRRPNVDSAELHELNRVAAAAEREESMRISANIAADEARAPKPERSDSWHFYGDKAESTERAADGDDDVDVDGESSSSPEPLYANQESTYGKLFEMATSSTSRGGKLLTPQLELPCISEDGELDSSDGAVGGRSSSPAPAPSLDLIKEFDPLMGKCSTLSRSNKSNELLLLEHLLEEDTYGTLKREQDDVSMCTSEEDGRSDNPAPGEAAATTSTGTGEGAATAGAGAGSRSQPQIVHQNAQLLSDSMENMLDDDADSLDASELRARPFLSRVPEKPQAAAGAVVDLSAPSRNRTNWFVPDKAHIEGDSPPTYLEAIGGDGQPVGATVSSAAAAASSSSSSPSSAETKNTLGSRLRQTMSAISNVKFHMEAMKRRASFKNATNRQSNVKIALQMVPRPSLSPLLVRYEGPLVRFPSGVVEDILKEMQNRKAILRDRQFQTYLDQEMKTPKELIPLETITTLQCVSNNRVTDSATHFYCFELTTSQPKNGNSGSSTEGMSSNPNLLMTSNACGNVKQQRVAHLYGVGKESERGVWMQKILESLTNSVPVKYTCHYYRAGWCYLKNSITSEWSGTWLVLRKSQRRLIFVSEATGNVEKMDLRKARCIVLKESDESIDNLHVESGPMLMIDCPPYAVYMIMSSARETKIWRHIIREVAHNNGFSLGDQQLTRYDVPVIVDKCINFVYIHGSMSEGIYRKSGSENSMHKLMSAFRADAFNVEITRNEYNEHDVANVLKRFMRDLPERLLGKLTDSFVFVTELAVASEKIPIYRELLSRLSIIEHETLRRIVGHLVFISSQQSKNKMSVQNLTMIWGPTLLAKKSDELIYSQKEADVLSDLIVLYKNLFPCSADEMKKEQAMLMCLQKYYAAAETLKDAVKQSGDIKIWISLNPNPDNTTEEKTQVNATISPTKTAYELCREYSQKMRLPTHQLTLYEVILNDSLERPLHHDTKVFDVILNWSYWPEEDRKHNYLVVRPIDMLREVQRAVKNLATVTPGKELRFADNRTKTFKTLQCELRDGKIVVSKKDKNDKTTIVREIFLHSSTAYLGCERKRDFPWSWAITFVERTQAQIMRSRDAPFIGHVLAGIEWVDRTIWYSSIWYCLHGENILPPAEIILK